MGINTFFQLLALKKQQPKVLEQARRLLFMPDLFSVMLGGKPVCERSIASTSQMLDPRIGLWSGRIEEVYGISTELFPPLVDSGTITGTLPQWGKNYRGGWTRYPMRRSSHALRQRGGTGGVFVLRYLEPVGN